MPGRLARSSALAIAGALEGATRDAVDLLSDQVLHDLYLLFAAAVLALGR